MLIQSGTGGSLILGALQKVGSNGSQNDERQLSALANRSAGNRLGIQPGELPGSYRPIYDTKKTKVTEDVYATRDVTRVDAVFEKRAIAETRDVTEDRAIYEDRAIFQDRAVYTDRAIYQNREIRQTDVDGTKSISGYKNPTQAGIDIGADFSVQVGTGPVVKIKFDSTSRISVTTGSTVQQFSFTSANGSFAGALASALDSVDGLSAGLSTDGKLKLTTDNAQDLKIAEVANGLLDFSRSPLASLGLTAGTTTSKVTGYQQVQTGTERVQTGTERVQTGVERIQTGIEKVKVGTTTVTTGFQQVKVGETVTIIGSERVKTGTLERTVVGSSTLVGLERTDDPGVGALDLLDRLVSSSLPPGYLEALFGALDNPKNAAPLPGVRNAYSEASRLGDRDDAKSVGDMGPNVREKTSRSAA